MEFFLEYYFGIYPNNTRLCQKIFRNLLTNGRRLDPSVPSLHLTQKGFRDSSVVDAHDRIVIFCELIRVNATVPDNRGIDDDHVWLLVIGFGDD